MRSTFWLLLCAASLFAAAGCSDNSTAPAGSSANSAGLMQGEVGKADFQITLGATGDENHRRCEGPFVLRGSNLHYEDSLAVLSVDLTITNNSRFPYAEPITLTFVNLLPEGVTVANPDNGINGEGAAINFAFANDDGKWTPEETSLPRTVQFNVDKGVAVAFSARLDIGAPIDGGTIAGLVWNDADSSGTVDSLETGVPGQRILLRSISEANTVVALNGDDDDDDEDHDGEDGDDDDDDGNGGSTRRVTLTDRNGLYAFNHLKAGVYVVTRLPNANTTPTTPIEITVLLAETEGDVSDFTDANFGVMVEIPNPFPVGVYAAVGGDFATDPDRLIARDIGLARCGPQVVAAGNGNQGQADCSRGVLRGAVTAVDGDAGTFAVMGTSVSYDPAAFETQVAVDQRLDVRVHIGDDGSLTAERIRPWDKDSEQVLGPITHAEVVTGAIHLTVLNTLVVVAPTVNPHH